MDIFYKLVKHIIHMLVYSPEMLLNLIACSVRFYYQSFSIAGLNVTECGHDSVMSVKNELQRRGIKNSFDTWHGKSNLQDVMSVI